MEEKILVLPMFSFFFNFLIVEYITDQSFIAEETERPNDSSVKYLLFFFP